MKIAASLSINLNKIDKSRIKEVTLKDGSVAKFINLYTTLDSENEGKYGDHGFISHAVTKDERDAGQKGAIIGNGKIVFFDAGGQKPSAPSAKPSYDDDLPF